MPRGHGLCSTLVLHRAALRLVTHYVSNPRNLKDEFEPAQQELEPVEDGLERVLTDPRAHALHLALLESLPGPGAAPPALALACRKLLLEGPPEPLSTQEKAAVLLDAETLTQARSRYTVRFT